MKTQRAALGREAISAITAVEGLALSLAGRARRDAFDRANMSANERRAAIAEAHRPGVK
jgi:hypothetical protein